jgi:hypothetical protein
MEWIMNLEKTLSTAVVVAALGLSSLPAAAQGRSEHQRGGGRATASQPAQQQGGGRQATARQAPSQAPAQAPGANRSYQAQGPQAVPRNNGGQYAQQAPRAYDNRQYAQQAPRQYSQPAQGGYQNRAVPRPYAAPPVRGGGYAHDNHYGYGAPQSHGYYSHGPSYSRGYYGGYYARPYYGHVYARPYGWTAYRPYYFPRAYYSFNPWFSIGFGVWIGYPVPYPWAYLGTYQPRVYGTYDNGYYDNSGSYNVTPGSAQANYGGVSFDIQPADADIFVDGQYAGTVGTFTPRGEPLTLAPGQHRIAVQRDGYRALEFDVTVEPGQVIPYRGTMERF